MDDIDTPGTESHRRHFATFSRVAYHRDTPLPEGYEIDTQFTSRDRVFAVNHAQKRMVVAHRGTDLGDTKNKWRDLGNDALLAVGLQAVSKRFRNGVRYTRAAMKKYPDYQTTVTGFSLGGSVSAHIHAKLPSTRYVGYSAHTPVTKTHADVTMSSIASLLKPRKKDSSDYVVALDPISSTTVVSNIASSHGNRTFVVPQKVKSPHSLDNYF